MDGWHRLTGRNRLTVQDYFSSLPVLETPRLKLRKLSMKDAKDIFRYSSDPRVAEHVLWHAHTGMQDVRDYLHLMMRQYRDGEPSTYAMVLKENDRVIGTIGFMAYDQDNNSAQIGYSMARDLWGQGLMTEAVKAVLKFSFEDLKLHRVYAMYETANPASGRVMEKCGMRHEGVQRSAVFNKGHYSDVALCAILEEEWKQHVW